MYKTIRLSILCCLFILTAHQHSYTMDFLTADPENYLAAAESETEKQPVTINNYYNTNSKKTTGQQLRATVKVVGGMALLFLGLRYGKMVRVYTKDVVTMPARVKNIHARVKAIEKNMATKEQCDAIRAKLSELKAIVATKEDLATLATKSDLSPLATKEQVAALSDILEKMLPA